MSVTLRKIASEVIRLESGGSPSNDSELSVPYVILMVRQALNKLIAPMIFANLNADAESPDKGTLPMLVVGYEVTVEGSTKYSRWITHPDFYIHLPFNRGLRGIAPVDDPTNHFIPRQNPAVSRNLPCAILEKGQYSYYTEGNKSYFDDSMPFRKVLAKYVVAAPDSVGEDDNLPIYPEMQYDAIMLVRQMLANTPLQDKKLDNNKEIGVRK